MCIGGVYLSVYGWMDVGACACTCMWRAEEEVTCVLSLLIISSSKADSLSEPGAS